MANSSTDNLPSTTSLWLSGIAMVVFGVIAIASPLIAGTAVVWVIGGLMTVAGIFHCFQSLREDSWGSKLGGLILGILLTIGGLGVLGHPLLGLSFLTLLLALFFVVEGIWKIIASFSYRPAPGWIGLLLSGLIGFLLGWMIWSEWPLSGVWAVGVLVGVDLLMTGASLIGLAITIKSVASAQSSTAMPTE